MKINIEKAIKAIEKDKVYRKAYYERNRLRYLEYMRTYQRERRRLAKQAIAERQPAQN